MVAAGVVFLVLVVTLNGVNSQNLRLNYYSITSYSYGRLEILFSEQWVPFTINGFDMHKADLACRRLGYGFASRYTTVGAIGYSRSPAIYTVQNLECSRTATSFSSCTYQIGSPQYSHYSDVGLQCTNSKSSLRLISNSGYTGGSSGRLQIYINSTWGTVCDDNFGSLEAGIACRQLGYAGYSTYDNSGTSYQPISYGPIWLDNLDYCNSYSSDLRNCTKAVGVHDCSHSEDIILTCSSTSYSPEYPTSYVRDLRLVSNGYTYSYYSGGRLEIYYPNSTGQYSWLPFCYYGFTSRAADLACKQLGFRRAAFYDTVGTQGYGSSSSSSYISSVSCYTSESELRYCTLYTSSGGCSAFNNVALRCSNSGGISTAGLITSVVIGPLALVSCCCVGILMCVVVAGVVSHKKSLSRVRTTNVVQDLPHNNLSNIAAQENVIIPTPAPPYTPSPIPPAIQQENITNPQSGNSVFPSYAYGEEKNDFI